MDRVCFLRFGGIGDILLTTPAVRSIAIAHPNCQIDYIVESHNVEVLQGIPYIRRVIPYTKSGGLLGSVLRLKNELAGERYDWFVNYQPSIRTKLIGKATGAKRKITYDKDLARHALDDFLLAIAPMGCKPDGLTMDFAVPESASLFVEELLASSGLMPDEETYVVNPGASHAVNRLPEATHAAVIRSLFLKDTKLRAVVIGGPGETESADQVKLLAPTAINLSGDLDLKELGALLKRSKFIVTGDTGPMHMAAALDLPIVAAFGAADEHRSGPKGVRFEVVRRLDLDCAPCKSRTCARGDLACMNGLKDEGIVGAALKWM